MTRQVVIISKRLSYKITIPDFLNRRYQGRIEPPKAARGHATSNSANIDSIVLNVTKNRGLVLRVRPPIL